MLIVFRFRIVEFTSDNRELVGEAVLVGHHRANSLENAGWKGAGLPFASLERRVSSYSLKFLFTNISSPDQADRKDSKGSFSVDNALLSRRDTSTRLDVAQVFVHALEI
jgi:hypothetical protein